jgi:L-lactate dehydrogenase complex protein LldG
MEGTSDSNREAFLARVRQAVREGNHAGVQPPLPERGRLGYQGAGDDPVSGFCTAFEAAGGKTHIVPDDATARLKLFDLLTSLGASKVLLGGGPVIDRLGLAEQLKQDGREVIRVAELTAATAKEPFFAADVGVTGVAHLIAETGSLVVETGPALTRSESLLPPVHVAVVDRAQIVPDLFDLFPQQGRAMPSCLTLITGPSKTGDIELRLVTGVHGPGEVYVILINGQNRPA